MRRNLSLTAQATLVNRSMPPMHSANVHTPQAQSPLIRMQSRAAAVGALHRAGPGKKEVMAQWEAPPALRQQRVPLQASSLALTVMVLRSQQTSRQSVLWDLVPTTEQSWAR